MKESVLKILEEELFHYRKHLAFGGYQAVQIVEMAYQIAVKQEAVKAVQYMAEKDMLAEEMWVRLFEQESTLDYLAQLWLDCNETLIPEMADILTEEIKFDMEVHNHE